jgi:hypothetical protein
MMIGLTAFALFGRNVGPPNLDSVKMGDYLYAVKIATQDYFRKTRGAV